VALLRFPWQGSGDMQGVLLILYMLFVSGLIALPALGDAGV
jgi:hypothetical protein